MYIDYFFLYHYVFLTNQPSGGTLSLVLHIAQEQRQQIRLMGKVERMDAGTPSREFPCSKGATSKKAQLLVLSRGVIFAGDIFLPANQQK